MGGTSSSHDSTGHGCKLAALIGELVRNRTGGVLSNAIELLSPTLHAVAAIGYRFNGEQLSLVAERGVPMQARPWLAQLPLGDDTWFIAQRAARDREVIVVRAADAVRDGHAAQDALTRAGWTTIAAAPMVVGRQLRGVLVIASRAVIQPKSEAATLLEATAGVLALALERDMSSERERNQQRQKTETAELATMGMLSTQHALDTALPLGALTLQLERHAQALSELRATIENSAIEHTDGSADLKEGLLAHLDTLTELSADMETGVRDAQGSASRLLSFSRHSKTEAVDLTRVLERCVSMVRGNLSARGIRLMVRGDDQPMLVDGRAESLQMMLVQLLLYAADSCDEAKLKGGTVQVALEFDGPHHVIRLETSGKAPASTRRVFDAWVRKERSPLGLGLAKQTVLAHNGHIGFGSSKLGGLHLSVVLPASATQMEARSSAPPADSLLQPLLAVGIDSELAETLRRDLKAYRVHTVATIAEAQRALAAAKPPPEMILCELQLPDGSGTELHAAVSDVMAHRFVFVTGGVMPADAAGYLRRSSCPTLIHPITAKEVKLLLSDDYTDHAAPTLGARTRKKWRDTITEPPASAPRKKGPKAAKKSSRERMASTLCESPKAKASIKPPPKDEEAGS